MYEGTSGSTGISLAQVAIGRGYRCHIFMPSDQSLEKSVLLQKLGAVVERVPPVSYSDPTHFIKRAEKAAAADANGFFANQFDNEVNWRTHYATTGPEIWHQTHGCVDAFVMGSGTGGTLAGVSRYLKEQNPAVKIYLIDPPGSGLYHKVVSGVCYSETDAEGTRRRTQVDTLIEGIGLKLLTDNFNQARIDGAL